MPPEPWVNVVRELAAIEAWQLDAILEFDLIFPVHGDEKSIRSQLVFAEVRSELRSRRRLIKTASKIDLGAMMIQHLLFSELLAQTGHAVALRLPPPFLWLTIGVSLSVAEFWLAPRIRPQYRFILLPMGVSALFLTLVLWRGSVWFGFDWQYMDYEGFEMQILYWMGVALALVIWVRPMFFRWKRPVQLDAEEAETLTELQPGQIGRVLYEGSLWQACCENYAGPIAPHQKVYVLRREGNTLIVAPESLFRS